MSALSFEGALPSFLSQELPMPALPDPDLQSEFYTDVAPKRLFAFLVDTGLIMLLVALAVLLTAFTGLLILPFLMLCIGFLYRFVSLSRHSATPGMRLMAIEFRTLDGATFTTGMAFWHTLGFSISLAIPLLQVISIGLMFTSRRGQGLTDHLLGSVAIHRQAGS